MKIKRFIITLTLSATLLFIMFSPLVQAYTNEQANFSITPPSGWNTKENVQGVIVQFIGPADPNTGAVNINVAVIETDLTLQGVVSETKQSWATSLSEYVLISEGDSVVNGQNGYKLEISLESNGKTVRQHTTLFVENDHMYQVNYVAGPTTYDQYFSTYLDSLETFKIETSGFSFSFEITGLPFIALVVAVIIIIVIAVIMLTRRKSKPSQVQYFPPPPP
ncbi:MAG: DcrB-related protein [Candidatus Bathyarchaeota archaeon]|nr:DcrB-related protein [Candidatus Bathyarchaeota archaeon]